MAAPRYRTENGRSIIDIQVKTTRSLFDTRDPAPFRERDIDDEAMAYILGAVDELPRKAPISLVVWLVEPGGDDLSEGEFADALRAQFAWERDRLQHRIREHLRRAQFVTLLGLAILALFLALAALVELSFEPSAVRNAVEEGLTIIGWVAIWRPIEALLYDWWPLVIQRRIRTRLLEAPVAVRSGRPPA